MARHRSRDGGIQRSGACGSSRSSQWPVSDGATPHAAPAASEADDDAAAAAAAVANVETTEAQAAAAEEAAAEAAALTAASETAAGRRLIAHLQEEHAHVTAPPTDAASPAAAEAIAQVRAAEAQLTEAEAAAEAAAAEAAEAADAAEAQEAAGEPDGPASGRWRYLSAYMPEALAAVRDGGAADAAAELEALRTSGAAAHFLLSYVKAMATLQSLVTLPMLPWLEQLAARHASPLRAGMPCARVLDCLERAAHAPPSHDAPTSAVVTPSGADNNHGAPAERKRRATAPTSGRARARPWASRRPRAIHAAWTTCTASARRHALETRSGARHGRAARERQRRRRE